tara:strand:+ start:199 stop:1356 length:1158 start_codon:yes stop_codon:yes gene_type:complete
MSVTRTALIVMRIMNAMMVKYPAGHAMVEQNFARFAKKANLTHADIVAIGDVLIAISLMTNANVATVRDPSLYDPAKAERIQDAISRDLLNLAADQLGIDVSLVASKKHYEIANKIFMDTKGSIITTKDMQEFLRNMDSDVNSMDLMMDLEDAVKDDVRPDILYRGLKNMSYESWLHLVDAQHEGRVFDIGKGIVSFSRERSAAEDFMDGRNPILMIMKNPKKKGIPAEKLSYWPTEWETIITEGKINIDSYKMTGMCNIVIGNKELGQRGDEDVEFTIYSDDRITIRRNSTKWSKSVTAQTPTSNEEGGAVDGRWFVMNIVSKIGEWVPRYGALSQHDPNSNTTVTDKVRVPLFDAKQVWDDDYWAEVISVKSDWRLIVECTLL